MASFEDIEGEIKNVMDFIEKLDEDMTEEQQAQIDEYLSNLAQAESTKVDNFGFVIRALTDSANNKRELANEILAKARANESAIERLKQYYLVSMKKHNLTKIKGDVFSISRRSNASVIVDNLSILPQAYYETKTQIVPDKKAISNAIKAGNEIPGARLEWNDSLQVR